MIRYKLIANPQAGRGRARRIIRDTVRLLEARRVSYHLEYTDGSDHIRRIAAGAIAHDGYSAILSIGGDGTLHQVIQSAVGSRKPIGIVPAGSGNDFAKALNMPKRLSEVMDVLLAGGTKLIDAGRMNERYFINGIGIGFDAAVNYNTRLIRGVKNGLAVYLLSLLKTLNSYKPTRMKITIKNETIDQELFLVSVGNGTTCGGGFKLTPYARIDDQLLDITMINAVSVLQLFLHLPKIFRGTIDRSGHAALRRAPALTIESRHPLQLHLDGEFCLLEGGLCEISVVPQAVTMIGNFGAGGPP